MTPLSRPPSREIPLTRRLSIEETYHLADTARRKTLAEATQNKLRLRLAHTSVLEQLLLDIAQTEAARSPSSSPPTTPKPASAGKHITWAAEEVVKTARYAQSPIQFDDEYDDGEEDLAGLSLVRTASRRQER